MKYDINDFIGVFDDVFEKEYCDSLINAFEVSAELNKTVKRVDNGYTPKDANNTMYFLADDLFARQQTSQTLGCLEVLQTFNKTMWECYDVYCRKYSMLESVGRHQLNPDMKIQKTSPSEGYHVWHCEHGGLLSASRIMLVMLYLNDVEEGGETEWLYQSRRVEPKMGRLVFCPAYFTHTHRGNPPLKGDKYMMNGWLQYYHEMVERNG